MGQVGLVRIDRGRFGACQCSALLDFIETARFAQHIQPFICPLFVSRAYLTLLIGAVFQANYVLFLIQFDLEKKLIIITIIFRRTKMVRTCST